MRPFLQDTVMFESLGKTLLSMAVTKPLFVPEILIQAGSSNRACRVIHHIVNPFFLIYMISCDVAGTSH